ncbi:MAG: DUF1059 domain-containing protein [Candidatus Micrarchaeota archaeon]|nr:DUF1059 domain-containing protein [Candidatus Micrarchaeota archaeon]
MEKVGMTCECGMEMRAPKGSEKALVAAIKFHAKNAHNMDSSDEDVLKMLAPVKEGRVAGVRGSMSDIM